MTNKLIHIAKITVPKEGQKFVYLRELSPHEYRWFYEESPSDLSGDTIEEAIRKGHKHWKGQYFNTLNCGFRYTLPERDEHGMNALFYQLAASFQSFNGTYFDEELGHNCYVQNASHEAIDICKKLAKENKL
ncbi:MAG: hypothetical protein VX777_04740 [Chlamydiota bacterium]|nr:hypothetical protein [Chlamydiota bacterium]